MTCGDAEPGPRPAREADAASGADGAPGVSAGRGVRGAAWVQAVAVAAALGLANELAVDPVRPGFQIGVGDHVVLAPLGLHWADPAAFAGDWFLSAAPQPHWSFDLLIALGARTGTLAALLTAYYLLALLAFGAATTVLARAWAPRLAWPAGLGLAVLASYQGVSLFGTNSPFAPLAVPNILGGQLAYLFLAALVTRRRWAYAVLPLVVVAHLQIGLLCLGVAALVGAAVLARLDAGGDRNPAGSPVARRLALPVVIPVVLAVALATFALWLRPVASDPRSFAEICRTLIPYHCAAGQWTTGQLVSSIAGAFLAVAAAALVPRPQRRRYLVALGPVALALVLALAADRAGVPVLATLVEGLNAYRAGVLLFPFACWGALVPLLGRPRGATGWVLALATAAAALALLTGPRAKVGLADAAGVRPCALLVAGLALAAALAWVAWRAATRRTVSLSLALLLGLGMVGAHATGYATGSFARPQWVPDDDARAWGEQVRRVVPPGTQVLIPPNWLAYRLPLERGVVADCKDIPYGGAPYRQWRERMTALGGLEQCLTGRGGFYGLSAARLDAAARTYGAAAILLPAVGDDAQVRGLRSLGYRAEPVRAGAYDTVLLRRDSAGQ